MCLCYRISGHDLVEYFLDYPILVNRLTRLCYTRVEANRSSLKSLIFCSQAATNPRRQQSHAPSCKVSLRGSISPSRTHDSHSERPLLCAAGVLAGVLGTAATGYILKNGSWDQVWSVAVSCFSSWSCTMWKNRRGALQVFIGPATLAACPGLKSQSVQRDGVTVWSHVRFVGIECCLGIEALADSPDRALTQQSHPLPLPDCSLNRQSPQSKPCAA